MSLEYLTLPHFLSRPEGEKLEMQVLRGFQAKGNLVWGQAPWPGGARSSLNSRGGFPFPSEAGKVKPQGQNLKPHWAHTHSAHSGFLAW